MASPSPQLTSTSTVSRTIKAGGSATRRATTSSSNISQQQEHVLIKKKVDHHHSIDDALARAFGGAIGGSEQRIRHSEDQRIRHSEEEQGVIQEEVTTNYVPRLAEDRHSRPGVVETEEDELQRGGDQTDEDVVDEKDGHAEGREDEDHQHEQVDLSCPEDDAANDDTMTGEYRREHENDLAADSYEEMVAVDLLGDHDDDDGGDEHPEEEEDSVTEQLLAVPSEDGKNSLTGTLSGGGPASSAGDDHDPFDGHGAVDSAVVSRHEDVKLGSEDVKLGSSLPLPLHLEESHISRTLRTATSSSAGAGAPVLALPPTSNTILRQVHQRLRSSGPGKADDDQAHDLKNRTPQWVRSMPRNISFQTSSIASSSSKNKLLDSSTEQSSASSSSFSTKNRSKLQGDKQDVDHQNKVVNLFGQPLGHAASKTSISSSSSTISAPSSATRTGDLLRQPQVLIGRGEDRQPQVLIDGEDRLPLPATSATTTSFLAGVLADEQSLNSSMSSRGFEEMLLGRSTTTVGGRGISNSSGGGGGGGTIIDRRWSTRSPGTSRTGRGGSPHRPFASPPLELESGANFFSMNRQGGPGPQGREEPLRDRALHLAHQNKHVSEENHLRGGPRHASGSPLQNISFNTSLTSSSSKNKRDRFLAESAADPFASRRRIQERPPNTVSHELDMLKFT
ncbi:unnamed protein product [Amoebophrya sp. A25]|nr:unnamed protein product [Amoebophrya sp. A25]|eukprot:GSA25T00023246001.1